MRDDPLPEPRIQPEANPGLLRTFHNPRRPKCRDKFLVKARLWMTGDFSRRFHDCLTMKKGIGPSSSGRRVTCLKRRSKPYNDTAARERQHFLEERQVIASFFVR